MDGVIALNKPAGMTSHDVVARVRRITEERSCGHTGTLDPGAEGVLVLCMGKATRLSRFMLDCPKEYDAEIVFGMATSTGDSEGDVIGQQTDLAVSRSTVIEAMESFRGDIEQVPPMVSAVHHDGARLYELARKGIEVHRDPRPVHIYDIAPIQVDAWPDPLVCGSRGRFSVRCSKGTYIRTLCEDICSSFGALGHMGRLVRTECSGFRLSETISLAELAEKVDAEEALNPETRASELSSAGILRPMTEAVNHLDHVIVGNHDANLISHGTWILAPSPAFESNANTRGGWLRIMSQDGRLLAIGSLCIRDGSTYIRPQVVF